MSDHAKLFIDKLLVVDPGKRMTAEQALQNPWIASSAASSSLKNLQRSFSENWRRSTSRLNSARSNSSQKSNKSVKSGRSVLSLPRRKNGSTVLEDTSLISNLTSVQAQDIKQGGNRSSGLKESNIKLTKQFAEKLHSVIDEDDRELLSSSATECDPSILMFTKEGDSNKQQVATQDIVLSSSLTTASNRRTKNAYEVKIIDSIGVQCAAPQDVIEEEVKGIPIPIPKDRSQQSRLVMRDNFLGEHGSQEAWQDCSQDSVMRLSFHGESSPRHCSLSPSPRKNKVYCTYDSS